jgi:hypothetical protein
MFPEGSTCQTIHDELLNFEALNAVPLSIHFLNVICFLIQHERYSDEGLVWAQSILHTNIAVHLTEQQHQQSLRTAGNFKRYYPSSRLSFLPCGRYLGLPGPVV